MRLQPHRGEETCGQGLRRDRETCGEPGGRPNKLLQRKFAAALHAIPSQGHEPAMTLVVIATICAGLFSGAALYINLVEHPARLACGSELAVREFAPSYKRATFLQVPLALVGSLAGGVGAWRQANLYLLAASLLLAAVVPFTLVVILPTNHQLLDPALDPKSDKAAALLSRWGRLHAVRTLLSLLAFLIFVWQLAAG